MKFKIGTVTSNTDITRTGRLKVAFDLQENEVAQSESVRYVSPFGNSKAAFVAVPGPGSTVLCGYSDNPLDSGDTMKGWFYLGSVMGVNPTEDRLGGEVGPGPQLKPVPGRRQVERAGDYTPTDRKPGTYGPPSTPNEVAYPLEGNSPFPDVFAGMYDAKGLTPEVIGLTGDRADSFLIHNRSRGNKATMPFQDYVSEIRSGNGKTVRCVDSPIVDGIVIANEHKGKDYIIFSSGNSEESPFAAGELYTRTHGPINTHTLESNIHMWIDDGRNIQVENKSSGENAPYGPRNGDRGTNETTGSPASRVGDAKQWTGNDTEAFGNESYGCVQVWSHHNNVSLATNAENSVIHIDASGANSKIVVRTGGTVDIVANKKITLTSDTEVELNAPTVKLNGTGANGQVQALAEGNIKLESKSTVDIDGEAIHLN